MQVKERSAGVIPLRQTPAGWRVLVLRAWKSWDFPKGKLEPGEALLDAARREAAEEAALTDLTFPWGEERCDTAPYGKGKVASYFMGRTEQDEVRLPINPSLGRAEHHEGRWVDLDEAARLLPPRLQPILAWARARLEA